MKILLSPLALLLSISSVDAQAVDPAEIELSPVMRVIMQRGLEGASTQLGMTFERYSEDGESIDLARLSNVADRERILDRAQKVASYLAVDANWDGIVTRDELEQFFAPEDQLFIDGYLRDGDLDGDGRITLDEMQRDAANQYPETSDTPSDGYLQEMLAWDLNGDGILHSEEVLSVIIAHAQ